MPPFYEITKKTIAVTMNDNSQKIHCGHSAMRDIADMVPNPRNPNKHDDKQVALLAKIIRHQGWRAPIVVSKRSGFIVVGHGRLEAAKLLGLSMVPVDVQDFATEADEWAHLIADNRIAELAEIDDAEMNRLLSELDVDGFDMDLTGFIVDGIKQGLGTKPELTKLEPKAPPKFAWIFIGIPLVQFGEINQLIEQIASIETSIVEISKGDEHKNR